MATKHSFPPVVDARVRLLVCGSLPGDASLAAGRYYAHPQNGFWALMSPVTGVDLVPLTYDARLAALLAARIGLWDVIASARREGSSDGAIRGAAAADLAGLVARLPRCRAVAFNGGTAARIGGRALGDAAVARVTLPSSSPLNTVGLAAKAPAWAALRDWLA